MELLSGSLLTRSCPATSLRQGAFSFSATAFADRRPSPWPPWRFLSAFLVPSAFTKHHKETEKQVDRLDQVFELLGKRASGKKCPAIDGIIEEAEEVMKEAEDDTIRDAAMLAAAQSVEHYEISRYGTLVAWAEKMEMSDAAELLRVTLGEEKLTDEKLTELAESEINVEAEQAGEEEEEDPPKRRAAGGRR